MPLIFRSKNGKFLLKNVLYLNMYIYSVFIILFTSLCPLYLFTATVTMPPLTAAPNTTLYPMLQEYMHDHDDCEDLGGKLHGLGCTKIPDVFFFSCLVFLGTFTMAYSLKFFRNKRYFPTKVRLDLRYILALKKVESLAWNPDLNILWRARPTLP